jgi:hypothetical protein
MYGDQAARGWLLAGRVLPRGNREIVFDEEGRAIGVGPLLKKGPM